MKGLLTAYVICDLVLGTSPVMLEGPLVPNTHQAL